MAFLLFEKRIVGGKVKIRPTGTAFSLAGYNHAYPVDAGWSFNV